MCICCPYRLCLLCLGELSAPSMSSVAHSICVCCLCLVYSIYVYCILVSCLLYLHLPWLALSASSINRSISVCFLCPVPSICIYCASMSCLPYLRLLWLALSTSTICASSTPSVFAMFQLVILFVGIFHGSLRLRLLSISHPFHLPLLYLGELSALFASSLACFICVFYGLFYLHLLSVL